MKIKTKSFGDSFFIKILEMITSVKVLTIFIILFVSTKMLMLGHIDGVTWASMNGTIISTVYAMREVFKVQKIKELSRNETGNEIIKEIRE